MIAGIGHAPMMSLANGLAEPRCAFERYPVQIDTPYVLALIDAEITQLQQGREIIVANRSAQLG